MRYRIGVGINVNGHLPPVEVPEVAISMRMATGALHDRNALLEGLARAIDQLADALAPFARGGHVAQHVPWHVRDEWQLRQ